MRSLPVASCLLLAVTAARATTIQDLVRVKGHERNTLVGLGIVVGLDGTGDRSKDSLVAARPYEQLLRHLGNPVASIQELAKADAYAIVQVTMEIPATGVRSGDRLDVSVSVLFNASSIVGGELVVSPLRVPLPGDHPPMAFANGPVVLEGDNPRRGLVRGGGQMMADIRTNPLTAAGALTLVLKDQYAGYPMASMIANVINDEFSLDGAPPVARVEDAKNVTAVLPPVQRADPAAFIARVLTINVHPSLIQTPARVVVNEHRGIILVTGEVEVGPVLITHKDLSITTISPRPQPSADAPQEETRRWAELNTTGSERGAARLTDLLRAFDQLNVPVLDQIAIVHELKKTGKLHAEIVTQ